MACFQAFVTHQLLPSVGLFRAKGFVWFQQQRSLHYIFHVSGKQRAECGATGTWQGAPGVQVVLIGQDQPVLLQLKQQLQECVAGCCACIQLSSQQPTGHQAGMQTAGDAMTPAGSHAAAVRFAQLVQDHHRFQLWQQGSGTDAEVPKPHVSNLHQQVNGSQGLKQQAASSGQQASVQQDQQQQQGQPQQQDLENGTAQGLVQFTAIGSALHGVIADEVGHVFVGCTEAVMHLIVSHAAAPMSLWVVWRQHMLTPQVSMLGGCLVLCGSWCLAPAVVSILAQSVAGCAVLQLQRSALYVVAHCTCAGRS
jgi:hypothetical protein